MSEEFDPVAEGRRIVSAYLSHLGWAKEWRRSLNTQLYPAFEREELEEKERLCDQREEEAEAGLSSQVERWRHDDSPQAKEVLRTIFDLLRNRNDLGFFAKRIVEHLRRIFAG
ncbi:MAG: hypothetical protein WC632_03820 [Candidatus Margulisiibacteriota bacterium]